MHLLAAWHLLSRFNLRETLQLLCVKYEMGIYCHLLVGWCTVSSQHHHPSARDGFFASATSMSHSSGIRKPNTSGGCHLLASITTKINLWWLSNKADDCEPNLHHYLLETLTQVCRKCLEGCQCL